MENNLQWLYTYDANNNRISYTEQDWNGTVWINDYQYVYTYDTNNIRTDSLRQYWNGITWIPNTKNLFAYDINNNLVSDWGQRWNGSAWINRDSTHYYYHIVTGMAEVPMHEELTIYPNPLTSSFTLQLTTQLKDAEVVVYDMLGKEMVRKKLTGGRMEIERGSLESGVYVVRVRSEERQSAGGRIRSGEWVGKVVVQ